MIAGGFAAAVVWGTGSLGGAGLGHPRGGGAARGLGGGTVGGVPTRGRGVPRHGTTLEGDEARVEVACRDRRAQGKDPG